MTWDARTYQALGYAGGHRRFDDREIMKGSTKASPHRVNGRGHGTEGVTSMQADLTSMPRWSWTFAAEEYREGSSRPWSPVEGSGVVAAEHPAVAAILLFTGLPYDGHPALPFEELLPEYDGERGFSLTIKPLESPVRAGGLA